MAAGVPVCGGMVATVMGHRCRIGILLRTLETFCRVARGETYCDDRGKAQRRLQTGAKETGSADAFLQGGRSISRSL